MINSFAFGASECLWLALGLIPVGALAIWFSRRRRSTCAEFGVNSIVGEWRMWRHFLAMIFVIIALAKPQWGETVLEVPAKSLVVVAILDASPSMAATDVYPSRMVLAQRKAIDLSHQLEDVPMGLVAFSGGAYPRAPLTKDKRVLERLILDTTPSLLRQKGSNLASALEVSQSLFDPVDKRPKAIVIFSDGEDHSGKVLEKLVQLKNAGISVFTVGIGSTEGGVIPLEAGGFLEDNDGSPILSVPNLSFLAQMADSTGGMSVHVSSHANDIDLIVEKGLLSMADPNGVQRHTIVNDAFWLPLLIAFLCLFAFPVTQLGLNRSALVTTLSICLGFCLWPLAAQSDAGSLPDYSNRNSLENDAIRVLSHGNSTRALPLFNRLISSDQPPKDQQRFLYNAGLAAYHGGQLHLAYRHFKAAADLGDSPKATFNAKAVLREIQARLQSISTQQSASADQQSFGQSRQNPEQGDSMPSESLGEGNGPQMKDRQENDKDDGDSNSPGQSLDSTADRVGGRSPNLSKPPLTSIEMNRLRATRILDSVQSGKPHLPYGDQGEGLRPW